MGHDGPTSDGTISSAGARQGALWCGSGAQRCSPGLAKGLTQGPAAYRSSNYLESLLPLLSDCSCGVLAVDLWFARCSRRDLISRPRGPSWKPAETGNSPVVGFNIIVAILLLFRYLPSTYVIVWALVSVILFVISACCVNDMCTAERWL